jgi:phosphoglycerate kinase
MFNKKGLKDVVVDGKRVLVRVDFNVPLKNGVVGDDTRIRGALPTIQYLQSKGAKTILMSHLGRPDGEVKTEYSLKPVAAHLSTLLGTNVQFAPDCVGSEVESLAAALLPGQVLLLENLRFHREEELLNKYSKQDPSTQGAIDEFVAALARLGQLYVNDAFGTAHRAHASTAGVTRYFKENVAGFLMERELQYLGSTLEHPERPFVAILGGAKVSDKIAVIENLLNKVDTLIIGGAMAYTFLRAQNIQTGKSLVEAEQIDLARKLLEQAAQAKVSLRLPIDHALCASFADTKPSRFSESIGEDEMALDIGPKTIDSFVSELANAKTVVWNGPMGVFEKPEFAKGTFAIAHALATLKGATTIVGGGDSVAAVNQSGIAEQITHISTGGGASLELLEGKVLPGVAALSDR